MQVLIHKTNLVRLDSNLRISGIRLGDPVQLLAEGNADIAAFVTLPSRLPFGLGKSSVVRAGYLDDQATSILWPAIGKAAVLRVRIVGLLAAHLNGARINQISISVWGNSDDILPKRQRHVDFVNSYLCRYRFGPAHVTTEGAFGDAGKESRLDAD